MNETNMPVTIGSTTILVGKSLASGIKRVVKGAKTFHDGIHQVLVSSLYHAETYGDTRPLSTLVAGLPASVRVVAVRGWVTKYSPLKWSDEAQAFVMPKKKDEARPFNLVEAEANPFHRATEAMPAEFVLERYIQTIQNRLCEQVSKGKVGKDDVTAALLKVAEQVRQVQAA